MKMIHSHSPKSSINRRVWLMLVLGHYINMMHWQSSGAHGLRIKKRLIRNIIFDLFNVSEWKSAVSTALLLHVGIANTIDQTSKWQQLITLFKICIYLIFILEIIRWETGKIKYERLSEFLLIHCQICFGQFGTDLDPAKIDWKYKANYRRNNHARRRVKILQKIIRLHSLIGEEIYGSRLP